MSSVTTDRRLGLAGNTAYKVPATALATTNVTLSGEQTVGGVAVKAVNASGVPDRVLCTAQTNGVDNGLWDVSTGTWTRSVDANGNYDWAQGTQVLITQGSGAQQIWLQTTAGPIVVGTTAMAFSQSLSAGFLATFAASAGAALVGWIQAGVSAVARTVQSKLRDFVTPADFGAVGDGTTDDTTALQAALTACSLSGRALDGCGLTYKTTAQLTMAAGVTFKNAVIQMADSNYLALAFNSNCTIRDVKVLGTARTNQYPQAQRGIGEQTSGSTNVRIDARVEACNVCFDWQGTSNSFLNGIAVNPSGQVGVSEGYGALLYLGANRNIVRLSCTGAARHALYLSSGSSENDCVVHSSGTKSQWAVQINSTKNQALCSGNRVSGSSYGDYAGVIMAQDIGASDTGGAVQNNTVTNFEVYGFAAASGSYVANGGPAFETSFANEGTTPSTGNAFINCKALGQFNSTTLGIVEINSGWNTTVDGLEIRAVCLNAATGAFNVGTPAGGMQRFRNINIDLLTSAVGIVGAYFVVTNGNFSFDNVQIVIPGTTKVFYSGASASLRLGDGNTYNANTVVTAVGATSSKTATISVPGSLQNSYLVQALVTSESVTANPNTDVKVTAKGATSFTLSVYNGHSAPQDITVDYRIVGLPA